MPEIANAQVGVATAGFFPRLLLAASGGYASSTLTQFFSLPNRFWSIGPSIVETVFARPGLGTGLVDAIMGRQYATVQAIRDFNDHAAADDQVELVMLPIGDGLTLARKR